MSPIVFFIYAQEATIANQLLVAVDKVTFFLFVNPPINRSLPITIASAVYLTRG